MAKFLRLPQQANQFGLRIRRCLGAGKVAGDKSCASLVAASASARILAPACRVSRATPSASPSARMAPSMSERRERKGRLPASGRPFGERQDFTYARGAVNVPASRLEEQGSMRVLIVDDHPIIVAGCAAMLANEGDIEVFDARDAEAGFAPLSRTGRTPP